MPIEIFKHSKQRWVHSKLWYFFLEKYWISHRGVSLKVFSGFTIPKSFDRTISQF